MCNLNEEVWNPQW